MNSDEHACRHAAPAQVGAGASVAADGAHRDDGAVLVSLGAGRFEQPGHRPCDAPRPTSSVMNRPSTTARAAPSTHPARVGPRTAEQVQAGHDHRLARAGLAGEHRQAVMELRRRRRR